MLSKLDIVHHSFRLLLFIAALIIVLLQALTLAGSLWYIVVCIIGIGLFSHTLFWEINDSSKTGDIAEMAQERKRMEERLMGTGTKDNGAA